MITYSLQCSYRHTSSGTISLTAEEFSKVKPLCKENFWKYSAQLLVVRTDSLENLAFDLFIPAITRKAEVIKGISDLIFSNFPEFVLDMLTLPIRIVTLIPRGIYNALYPRVNVPLEQFLKEKGLIPPNFTRKILSIQLTERTSGQRNVWTQQWENSVALAPMPHFVTLPKRSYSERTEAFKGI